MTEEKYLRFIELNNTYLLNTTPELTKELEGLVDEMNAEFPWLIIHNRWDDRIMDDMKTINEWSDMPYGWAKAFGYQFLNELNALLIKNNLVDKFRIEQIKEKYGSLRFYVNAATKDIYDLIDKYEGLSRKYCIGCGKPSTRTTPGYILHLCDDCYGKEMQEEPPLTPEDYDL